MFPVALWAFLSLFISCRLERFIEQLDLFLFGSTTDWNSRFDNKMQSEQYFHTPFCMGLQIQSQCSSYVNTRIKHVLGNPRITSVLLWEPIIEIIAHRSCVATWGLLTPSPLVKHFSTLLMTYIQLLWGVSEPQNSHIAVPGMLKISPKNWNVACCLLLNLFWQAFPQYFWKQWQQGCLCPTLGLRAHVRGVSGLSKASGEPH